ncbi:RNA polymerase II C-terminal domain phosphatase-like 4 [Selaginella moellendorffii]|uniref:RNA polymerase II C-terminal domain phosphatase-like 4 n=1 Tax=Selaginella moellendorffii TaxID=88036 RepID=UPI000D1C71E1|nr:RNA polymerase II C-terminal domain phosphatase-like 4 [Selaginella moellendorffii]|eukprot:XP_002989717.2 RNA polymerase II C-terminal domain phosphatase-like 4 [Selaginella moellendorffii]
MARKRERSECPPHPGFIKNLCFQCGQPKPESDGGDGEGDATQGLLYHKDFAEFQISQGSFERLREEQAQRALEHRKLMLVLDLDHTLVNSASFDEVCAEEKPFLESMYARDPPKGRSKLLHKLDDLQLWTKIRPFALEFLAQASKLFDLYVYTMGTRIYAEAMLKLLDPTGVLFKGLVSRNDNDLTDHRDRKDLDTVLGQESSVLIVDDLPEAWPEEQHKNLIQIDRYHFFSSSCKSFGFDESSSLARRGIDESHSGGSLASLLQGLETIHRDFFQYGEFSFLEDVRDTVSELRSHILEGCKLAFSSVVPIDCEDSLWILCEGLGAECVLEIDDSVTHVVAMDPESARARWAVENGKHLVNPSWMRAAAFRLGRPRESEFQVRRLGLEEP